MISRIFARAFALAALVLPINCGEIRTTITTNDLDAQALATTGVDAATMIENISAMVDEFSRKYLDSETGEIVCISGEATHSINDVGPVGLSTGDSADFVFSGCTVDVDGDMFTLDGALHLSAEDIAGDTPEFFTREIRASFDSVTAVIRGVTVIIDGEITTSVSSSDGITLVAVASGNSLDVFAQQDDEAFSGTLTDFHSEATVDTGADTFSLVFEATLDTEELSGGAHVETTVPFTGTVNENPSAGTFVATGPLGATVTLIAVDNVNVRVLIDADGDGVSGTTVETTWDALDGIP